MDFLSKISESANYIKGKIKAKPDIGLILGSGLGVLAEEINNPVYLDYKEIPHFPVSTVKGHAGQLVLGTLEGKTVVAMQGRFHYYEGYTMNEVSFPVRVMKALGVNQLLVTNAAGGVNRDFEAGDLMVIADHINFSFDNPLIGRNFEELGPRFPDMSSAYDSQLIDKAFGAGHRLNIRLQKGTYMFLTGPTYETPAEVKMAGFLGADAVGMSTVPEVIAALHTDMKVLGISCITNMASGILDTPLNHKEVIETSERVKDKFIKLIKEILSTM